MAQQYQDAVERERGQNDFMGFVKAMWPRCHVFFIYLPRNPVEIHALLIGSRDVANLLIHIIQRKIDHPLLPDLKFSSYP